MLEHNNYVFLYFQGGWTLVTNIIFQDSNGFNWYPTTDYRRMSKYESNRLGISTYALATLNFHMAFTQLRFYCYKNIPGKTLDIMTSNNALGRQVVLYFTGKNNVFPKACGSFTRLFDDNSTFGSRMFKMGW